MVEGIGIMIQRKPLFHTLKPASALVLAAALGACASSGDYPGFAIPTASESTGRVAMRFPGVNVPEPIVAPQSNEAPPAELDAYLAAIGTRATAANTAFSQKVGSARSLAQAASGANAESDLWSNAQLRLADLTTYHSRAHIALADLDALAAKAELSKSSPADKAAIEDLRAELARTLDAQAKELRTITAQLAR